MHYFEPSSEVLIRKIAEKLTGLQELHDGIKFMN